MTAYPTHLATVVDQPEVSDRDFVDDLLVEDAEVEVRAYPGVVRAGIGATVWAHPGVVVDAEAGAVVHLAPGASLEEWRPGALERGDITVTTWHPTGLPGLTAEPQGCRACGCTDDRACLGGCWWVAPDLCSSCAPLVAATSSNRGAAGARETLVGPGARS